MGDHEAVSGEPVGRAVIYLKVFFALLIGHAIADFALQNDYVATYKARRIHRWKELNPVWGWVMSAHCLIHGGVVWLITGSMTLGLAETFMHFFIDFCKTEGIFDQCSDQRVPPSSAYHIDQVLHISCKLWWTGIALRMALP